MAPTPRIRNLRQLKELSAELGMGDWHEPDERNITAVFDGSNFDNAGHWPGEHGQPSLEMCVLLYRSKEVNGRTETVGEPIAAVNLATLFAWATGTEQPPQLSNREIGFISVAVDADPAAPSTLKPKLKRSAQLLEGTAPDQLAG